MDEQLPTTADLLVAWRDATRAAELAERLALLALDASDQASANALASEEIAALAENAALAADRAATSARGAATRARQLATRAREARLPEADETVVRAREAESTARHLFHATERRA